MSRSTINAWSASRADTFETCPYRASLSYVEKIPEPDRGDPPKGMLEWPNDRGTRVHDHAENYVRGTVAGMTAEMAAFETEYKHLRWLYEHNPRCVQMEGMWCFDDEWNSVAPDNYSRIWLRVKVDALVINPIDTSEAVVIDYKTGKRVYNEIKHSKQTQLYQLATFLRNPNLEFLTTELWYLDQNELHKQSFTRAQGLRFLKGFNATGKKITETREFKATPSKHNCRFCPYKTGMIGKYGPEGTGHCDKNPD